MTDEILAAAHRRLASDGASALSLRAIARDLDLGVSSLYRYFPSRDELLTALLVAAFDAQADAVEAASARSDEAGASLRAGLLAYRDWSLANPEAFALAYGTPVPGYVAPPERTVAAGTRVGDQLIGQLERARVSGALDEGPTVRRAAELTRKERRELRGLIARRGYAVPVGLMSLACDLFVHLHGHVAMEVFGQLRPLVPDADASFDRTLTSELDRLGLRSPSPASAKRKRTRP